MSANTWDDETDLLVLGSGAAGFSAAIFASVALISPISHASSTTTPPRGFSGFG